MCPLSAISTKYQVPCMVRFTFGPTILLTNSPLNQPPRIYIDIPLVGVGLRLLAKDNQQINNNRLTETEHH